MSKAIYNVMDFGARADLSVKDTAAFQAAADACRETGGILFVPRGDYLVSSIRLYSRTEVYLEEGARLFASTEEKDYCEKRGKYDTFYPRDAKTLIGRECKDAENVLHALILSTKRGATDCIFFAEDAQNISIHGGEIQGNGAAFFRITEEGGYKKFSPQLFRPQLLVFKRCKNIKIRDLALLDAPYYNIRAIECENIHFEGLRIETEIGYINTDGINISACKNASVRSCSFRTGDDCIAISNGEFTPLLQDCEGITVSSCTARTKANLVRVFNGIEADLSVDAGLGGEEQLSVARAHAVKNVRVSDCTLSEGACAINVIGVLGRIENIEFSDIRAEKTNTAIFMAIQKEGSVKGVSIRRLSCEAAGAATLHGTTRASLSDIEISDCDFHITPSPRLFGNGLIDPLIHYYVSSKAPYNIYLRHASRILIKDTAVRWGEADLRGIERFAHKENRPPEYEHLWREDMMPTDKFPCIDAYDVDGLTVCALDATGHRMDTAVRYKETENFSIR